MYEGLNASGGLRPSANTALNASLSLTESDGYTNLEGVTLESMTITTKDPSSILKEHFKQISRHVKKLSSRFGNCQGRCESYLYMDCDVRSECEEEGVRVASSANLLVLFFPRRC